MDVAQLLDTFTTEFCPPVTLWDFRKTTESQNPFHSLPRRSASECEFWIYKYNIFSPHFSLLFTSCRSLPYLSSPHSPTTWLTDWVPVSLTCAVCCYWLVPFDVPDLCRLLLLFLTRFFHRLAAAADSLLTLTLPDFVPPEFPTNWSQHITVRTYLILTYIYLLMKNIIT